MNRRKLLGWGAVAGSALFAPEGVRAAEAKEEAIDGLLEPIRKKHDLPALAAAVVVDGRTAAVRAVGIRKWGADAPVTAEDRFHIGSCTKAMTATLVGMLVEEGKLSWDLTLAKAFPHLADAMHPDRRSVTLEMLLCHRGGFPDRSWPEGKTFLDMHRLPGMPREQRTAYAELFLKEKPDYPGGEKFVYSNVGYALAGVMAERVTDLDWETLLARRIFQPLGMKSAGFGAMGTPGKIDQPWQHRLNGTEHQSVEPGPLSDNPPVIGPGGTVHCSVGDWAKFAAAHAHGERTGSGILKPETFRKLHTPLFGGDYAFGWIVTERGWGGGKVLTHTGSNTMNFAAVWTAPLKDFAVMAATNQAGEAGPKATDEACAALIGRFLGGK